MKIVPQSVTLEAITPNAAQLIERAGRTCYKSEEKIGPDTAGPFIAMIKKRGHDSVLEHASATFRIICDRGISHELIRHRVIVYDQDCASVIDQGGFTQASHSQESTRYCNYGKSEEITVIEPPFDQKDWQWVRSSWLRSVARAEISYLEMLLHGCPPQIARSVLPTCLKTEIVMTTNFREWLHFIRLRTAPAAHPQMREVAEMIRDILARECPEVFKEE